MRGRRVGTKGEALSFRPAVEHRRAGLRDLSLLVLCFVVLFPLVIFCVLTLPDEFTEFTHWAVRHYQACGEWDSAIQGNLPFEPALQKIASKYGSTAVTFCMWPSSVCTHAFVW